MSGVLNDCDALLQGASVRILNGKGAYINLALSAPGFHLNSAGVADIAVVSVRANLIGLIGSVNFSAQGGTLSNASGSGVDITYTGSSAVVTATVVSGGETVTRSIAVPVLRDGAAGSNGSNGSNGTDGISPPKNAVAFLYKWSTATPSKPAGTTTFTWAAAANTAYSGNDGWAIAPPANPGTPLIQLFVASIAVSDVAAATTTTVGYTNSIVAAWAQNGANGSNGSNGTNGVTGVQSGEAKVYQWAATIPAGPAGSPSFVWSTSAFGAAPASWTLTPGAAPSPGMTLWMARVGVTDSAAATSTSFNWTAATILAVGYAGANGSNGSNGGNGAEGASYVTAYCASSTASTTTAPSVTSGKSSVPASNGGGIVGAWTKAVPVLASGQFLYQSDGIYDPATGNVTWSIPYWSSLKVGTLSAITANLGAITAGSIDIGTGATSLHFDALGNLWIGAAAFGSAPFRVTNTGAMTALSGTFGGALTGQIVKASNMVVTGAAGTLNRDPYFTDPASWTLNGMSGATGPGGAAPANTYVQGTADYASSVSERFPIDASKSYNTAVSVWAASGNNRAFRTIVAFYDGAGNAITSSWSDNLGSHFTQNFTPGGDGVWRAYRNGGFGAKVAGRPIPANAKFCSVIGQINAGGSGTSSAMAATGLRVDEMAGATTIEPGSISTKHLAIAEGGDISSGQTGFDQGNGFWIEGRGNGHGARMSMGDSAGRKFICDPQNGILKMINPDLQVAGRTASISSNPGDSFYPSRTTTGSYCGTHTASINNPVNPTYSWSITSSAFQATFSLGSTTNAATTVNVAANGAAVGDEVECLITCVISDGGATASVSKTVFATFT
jgi:hypothetical protein